jgi:hypothetical protein
VDAELETLRRQALLGDRAALARLESVIRRMPREPNEARRREAQQIAEILVTMRLEPFDSPGRPRTAEVHLATVGAPTRRPLHRRLRDRVSLQGRAAPGRSARPPAAPPRGRGPPRPARYDRRPRRPERAPVSRKAKRGRCGVCGRAVVIDRQLDRAGLLALCAVCIARKVAPPPVATLPRRFERPPPPKPTPAPPRDPPRLGPTPPTCPFSDGPEWDEMRRSGSELD